jgi:hypothetical protein
MGARFFNDMGGPEGTPRLLIEHEFPFENQGERHSAVRVATEEDTLSYAGAYQAYVDAEKAKQEAAQAQKAAEQDQAKEAKAAEEHQQHRDAEMTGTEGEP